MNERTKTGLEILQVALVIGIAGDLLLRVKPWGLNVLLFNIVFAAAMIMLLRRHAPERLTGQAYALIGALIFFASMFVWLDSIELRVADTFAIIAILGVLFLPTLKISARVAGLFQYAVGVVWAGLNSVFSAGVLFGSDIHWNEMSSSGWRRTALSIFRGVLIALPLLLIFGALFVAADAVYEGWVRRVLNLDFELVFSHLALFGVFGWLSAGYLRGILFAGIPTPTATAGLSIIVSEEKKDDESPMARVRADSGENPVMLADNRSVVEHINSPELTNTESGSSQEAGAKESGAETTSVPKPTWSWANLDNSVVHGFTLGSVEIGVIFGLINLLFLSFVIVQVPYLFGGMELVQNTPDFKLAEYARRGFGELVTVSAIVLPMLLVSHWLLKKEDGLAHKLYRVLAGVQIALLFVIMASAAQRLVLLTGNLGYGMTTIRLYPLIFMTWLAIVFLWFAATVLRGARQHFAWGALWSAFFILGATHVLNPDEFIVKTNIALMREGRDFDAGYNASLSQDAIPALINALPELSPKSQCIARLTLWGRLSSRNEQENDDLRSWNFSRYNARTFLIENTKVLNYDHKDGTHTNECSESTLWQPELYE